MVDKYPLIASFMGGWFHQDFDVVGETVEEVTRAYQLVTPREQQQTLHIEIGMFLADHPDDTETAFEKIFRPDVIPSALSGSTRAFLQEVQELLNLPPSAASD